jgi:hypothetical protein
MAAPLRSLVSGLVAWMGCGLLALLLLLQAAHCRNGLRQTGADRR